jgi:hypothetical protein
MDTPTAYLLSTQNADGGWGYQPQAASRVEPTAAAVLALPVDEPARELAVAWLIAVQHADGGWGTGRPEDSGDWTTAWGVLALQSARPDAGAIEQGQRWLLEVHPWTPPADSANRAARTDFEQDFTLRGWPWRPNETPWVEPTALAMLALAPLAADPATRSRLDEGVRYLVNRRCDPGGWNVGNPTMLGAPMPLRAHPTAWAVLALQGCSPQSLTPPDLTELRREMHRDGGALALAWGLLALRTAGHDDPAAVARLVVVQGPAGDWNANPYHTAVASLALEGTL